MRVAPVKLSEMFFRDGSAPVVIKDGIDITNEIIRDKGKSNPFGWSAADLVRVVNINGAEIRERIASLYCGYPWHPEPGYEFFEKAPDGKLKKWE